MPFAAALSTHTDCEQAVEEVCNKTLERFEGKPDLAITFFSSHHRSSGSLISTKLRQRLSPGCLMGCSGEAIVGNDQEIEKNPAISLWLASMPKRVKWEPFHLNLENTPDGYSLMGWPDGIVNADPTQGSVLLLGDPFSFPVDAFLDQVNENYSGLRVMGGMASGAKEAGESCLLLGDKVLHEGAVGIFLQGPLKVRSIVSQGCRPIGKPLVITRAEENVIVELGGKLPLAQLQQLWVNLDPNDQKLFQEGLHIGRVINEYQGEFQRGDFLVRNVLGLDRQTGSLAITDHVRVGQTIQFHVRDAETADEDLHALLQMDLNAHEHRPQGALLFSCNGRGTRLFSQPNHDACAIRGEAGDIPLAGFFAAGELGPIGGQNFIHGFTASVVLFEHS